MKSPNVLYLSVLGFQAGLWIATGAQALSLADISGKESGGGLKEALTQGASKAVDVLGKSDGFLGNSKVKIPLPESMMRGLGMDKLAETYEKFTRWVPSLA